MSHPIDADELFHRLQHALGAGYRLERELGGGGMSRVFVARELGLDRSVVVKVLPENVVEGLSADRFRREIMLSAGLQHPNIVGVIAAGDSDGLPYFVMPLVEGESVRAKIVRDGALSVPATVAILRDVSRALAYAHARGIVHRDIKPDNILLSGGAAVVADFGVAKALVDASRAQGAPGQTLTHVGTSLGTPAYMAPEQVVADPNADQRVDIYALGVMAFEMLTGRQPFTGSSLTEVMSAHLTKPAEPLSTARPGVPIALGQLVGRCLEKDPNMRPQTAQEILQLLDDPAVVSGALPSLVAAVPSIAVRAGGRPKWLVPVGALAVVALAAGGWFVSNRAGASTRGAPPAIAVLPLELASRDSADAYLAQGIADELVAVLARIQGVKVASRLATRSLAAAADPAAAAKELGVTMTLEGTVQRRGERLRVTARLTNTADGFAVWSETYDRPAGELYALQGEIAAAVMSVVKADIERDATGSRLGRAREETVIPAAYDQFLRGHYLLARRGAGSIKEAVTRFEAAIALDSTFARAYAEMAQALAVLPLYTGQSASVALNAEKAARRALALDSTLASAHAALGYLQGNRWEWGAGRKSLERAVALDSTDATAMQWLGENYLLNGDFAQSQQVMARAEALDRESPVIAAVHAVARSAAGDLEGGIQAARRAVDIDPSQAVTRFMYGTVLIYAGQNAEAIDELREARRLAPGILPVLGALGHALVKTGQEKEARTILGELRADESRFGVKPAIAKILVALGDVDGAIVALQKAAKERDGFFSSEPLGTPLFEPVRRHPDFPALQKELGLDGAAFKRP